MVTIFEFVKNEQSTIYHSIVLIDETVYYDKEKRMESPNAFKYSVLYIKDKNSLCKSKVLKLFLLSEQE